jgi:sulfate adenylyltransferase large subunit
MNDTLLIERNIAEYLHRHEHKELLRFVTVGSVDDGKSTLIGRLLHDTHGIYEDQLSAVKRASKTDDIDFSLFTDGLKAEREQGITIDVAYRYFSTERRKFIIADTPGHVQYTRNMATGASTADVAIILIDARLGVLAQSRRHAFIASLLGIPELTVCVNKMDLCDFDQKVFDDIVATFRAFAERLEFRNVTFVPLSAKLGDNVVQKSLRTPWYAGPTLLQHLETVPIPGADPSQGFRYPVQTVLRPNLDYRAFAGQIAAGAVKRGDEILVLPSGKKSRVEGIDSFEGELPQAFAPQSVAIRLADEIDISRGDMLVHPGDPPTVGRRFDAMVVWLSERPLDRKKSYFLKHTTQYVRANVEHIDYRVDLESLTDVPTERFELNDIGRASISCHRPIFYDAYRASRATGAFVLIDSITNNTVAAGMILAAPARELSEAEPLGHARSQVSPLERRERMAQEGAVVWLTAEQGSDHTTLAYVLERRLFDRGKVALVLQEPGALEGLTRANVIGIFAADPSLSAERQEIVSRVGSERFVAVHVASVHTDAEDLAESICTELEQRGVI